jgi:hypothetical protein
MDAISQTKNENVRGSSLLATWTFATAVIGAIVVAHESVVQLAMTRPWRPMAK